MPAVINIILITAIFFSIVTVIMKLRIWGRGRDYIYSIDWDQGAWAPLAVAILCFVLFFTLHAHWNVRSVKADLINKKFGTNYTYKEMFWGGQVVQDMLEGRYERKTIDGNLKIELEK